MPDLSVMSILPSSFSSLLVRTDFTSDSTWWQVAAEAQRENEEGFHAFVEPISDPFFEDAAWEEVQAEVPVDDHGASVLFVVDAVTIAEPDHPILVVGLLFRMDKPPFRCVPSELWGVENNLNLCNMDWEDFTTATENGVFRGFRG